MLVLTKLSFGEDDLSLGNNSMRFWDIITLCFTCGKKKICQAMKKSQIIMNMIVDFICSSLSFTTQDANASILGLLAYIISIIIASATRRRKVIKMLLLLSAPRQKSLIL